MAEKLEASIRKTLTDYEQAIHAEETKAALKAAKIEAMQEAFIDLRSTAIRPAMETVKRVIEKTGHRVQISTEQNFSVQAGATFDPFIEMTIAKKGTEVSKAVRLPKISYTSSRGRVSRVVEHGGSSSSYSSAPPKPIINLSAESVDEDIRAFVSDVFKTEAG